LLAAGSAIELRDYGRAKSYVDQAGQLQPGNPDVMNFRGQVLRATDPKQAVRVFREAIERSPDDPRLPYELGVTYQKMGLNLEAKDAFQEAINLDPSFADAFYARGVSLRELGRNSDARQAFNEVTRLDSRRADAHIQAAEIMATQGDPKGAIASYEAAMKAEPKSANAVCEMGLMLVESLGNERKYLERGVKALERCVSMQPKHSSAFRKLGDAYRDMRKRKDAIKTYNKHLANNPDDLNNPLVCESLATLGAPCE
jgi:tetratricopeptide (TPR) repeat protein